MTSRDEQIRAELILDLSAEDARRQLEQLSDSLREGDIAARRINREFAATATVAREISRELQFENVVRLVRQLKDQLKDAGKFAEQGGDKADAAYKKALATSRRIASEFKQIQRVSALGLDADELVTDLTKAAAVVGRIDSALKDTFKDGVRDVRLIDASFDGIAADARRVSEALEFDEAQRDLVRLRALIERLNDPLLQGTDEYRQDLQSFNALWRRVTANIERTSRSQEELTSDLTRSRSRAEALGDQIARIRNLSRATTFQNFIGGRTTASRLRDIQTFLIFFGTFLGAGALGRFAKDSLDVASSLEEFRNKAREVFEDSVVLVENFIERSGRATLLARDQAFDAAATFGNLFNAIGVAEEPSARLSISLVALAEDLASFNDVEIDDVLSDIQSGLLGQARPLRKYGVQLSETRVNAKALELGLADTNSEISAQDKLLARYAIVVQDTAKAQGDLARTFTSTANQGRFLERNFRELQVTVGELGEAPFGEFLFEVNRRFPAAQAVIEEFSDEVDAALRQAFEFVLRGIDEGPQRISELAFALRDVFEGLATGLGEIGSLEGAGDFLEGFVDTVERFLDTVTPDSVANVARLLALLSNPVIGIGLIVFDELSKTTEGAETLARAFSALGDIADIVFTAIREVVQGLLPIFLKAAEGLTEIVDKASGFLDFIGLVDKGADSASTALITMGSAIERINDAIAVGDTGQVGDAFQEAMNDLSVAANTAETDVSDLRDVLDGLDDVTEPQIVTEILQATLAASESLNLSADAVDKLRGALAERIGEDFLAVPLANAQAFFNQLGVTDITFDNVESRLLGLRNELDRFDFDRDFLSGSGLESLGLDDIFAPEGLGPFEEQIRIIDDLLLGLRSATVLTDDSLAHQLAQAREGTLLWTDDLIRADLAIKGFDLATIEELAPLLDQAVTPTVEFATALFEARVNADKLNDAIRGFVDPLFSLVDADQRVDDAIEAYAELRKSGKATAEQLAEAELDILRNRSAFIAEVRTFLEQGAQGVATLSVELGIDPDDLVDLLAKSGLDFEVELGVDQETFLAEVVRLIPFVQAVLAGEDPVDIEFVLRRADLQNEINALQDEINFLEVNIPYVLPTALLDDEVDSLQTELNNTFLEATVEIDGDTTEAEENFADFVRAMSGQVIPLRLSVPSFTFNQSGNRVVPRPGENIRLHSGGPVPGLGNFPGLRRNEVPVTALRDEFVVKRPQDGGLDGRAMRQLLARGQVNIPQVEGALATAGPSVSRSTSYDINLNSAVDEENVADRILRKLRRDEFREARRNRRR